jgi:hypothetical protein
MIIVLQVSGWIPQSLALLELFTRIDMKALTTYRAVDNHDKTRNQGLPNNAIR